MKNPGLHSSTLSPVRVKRELVCEMHRRILHPGSPNSVQYDELPLSFPMRNEKKYSTVTQLLPFETVHNSGAAIPHTARCSIDRGSECVSWLSRFAWSLALPDRRERIRATKSFWSKCTDLHGISNNFSIFFWIDKGTFSDSHGNTFGIVVCLKLNWILDLSACLTHKIVSQIGRNYCLTLFTSHGLSYRQEDKLKT